MAEKLSKVVQLNVGGEKFTTLRSTLCQYEGTFLEALASGRHETVEFPEGYLFVDRNPKYFPLVLDFLRDCSLVPELPTDKSERKKVLCEFEYFGLLDLMFSGRKIEFEPKAESGLIYVCRKCGTHLSKYDDRASKSYHSGDDVAFLFDNVVNIVCGPPVQRKFMSGQYTVSLVSCLECKIELGWKYLKSEEKQNKFKERKVVLEKPKIKKATNKLKKKKRKGKKAEQTKEDSYACFSSLFMNKGQ